MYVTWRFFIFFMSFVTFESAGRKNVKEKGHEKEWKMEKEYYFQEVC